MREALCLALVAVAVAALAGCAAAPAQVDADPSGFALYRSGRLTRGELAQLCRLGVEEIVVLDGQAAGRECRLRSRICPQLRVRYDTEQDARRPVSAAFLRAFDAWVAEARREGRKIAFRCRHGWHRAGRLAAYYRMRFQQMPSADAIAEMERVGRFMWHHRQLAPQVEAMADFLAGRPCARGLLHCVAEEGSASTAAFPPDACP